MRHPALSWGIPSLLLFTSAPAFADEPAPSAPATRVSVVVAGHDETTPRQLALLEGSLLAELAKREGLAPVERPASASAPVDTKSTCPDEVPSCLTRLVEALGADDVVAVRLTRLGEARVLSLKRLHIANAEVAASVTKQLNDSDDAAYLMVLGEAVAELFADHPLRPGEAVGVPHRVVARWVLEPLPPWVFWTGVGLTVASTAACVTMGLLTQQAENEFNDLANSGGVVSGKRLARLEQSAESRATTTNVLIGTSVGLAAATALSYFFVDWGSDEETLLLLAPAPGGASVAVGGRF